jgi:hypothetical protein
MIIAGFVILLAVLSRLSNLEFPGCAPAELKIQMYTSKKKMINRQ